MTNGKKMLGLGVISFLAITIGSVALADGSETAVSNVVEEAPAVEQPPLPSDQHVIDVAVAELNDFFAELNRIEAEKAKKAQKTSSASVPTVEPNYDPGDGSMWDRLAQCESGGNWAYPPVSGGFSGGLMFHIGTWRSMGGEEFAPDAYLATREQQIEIAERTKAAAGGSMRPWPGCSRKFGWL